MHYEVWVEGEPVMPHPPGPTHAVAPGETETACGMPVSDLTAVDIEWLARNIRRRCEPCRVATGLVPGA